MKFPFESLILGYIATSGSTATRNESSGFPKLKPALNTRVDIGVVQPLGKTRDGSNQVRLSATSGFIETAPGFEPSFRANVDFAEDWLTVDPDGQHARMNLRVVASTGTGQSIDFTSTGVINVTPEVGKVLTMAPDMRTVDFGFATAIQSFTVTDAALKGLENNVFVGNVRLVVSETGVAVEFRQSVVVAATSSHDDGDSQATQERSEL